MTSPQSSAAGRSDQEFQHRGRTLRLPRANLPLGRRTLIMGIVNLTPDSFYDGGRHNSPPAAVAHALDLAGSGADIIDLGGESTRPGAEPVDVEEEWRRLAPVLRGLSKTDLVISVDTIKSEVARRACLEGAALVNDISGGTMDANIFAAAAETGAGVVVSHIRGNPRTMQQDIFYDDLMEEIVAFLRRRTAAAQDAGVLPESIIIDPGIGFGKKPEHNLEIMRRLDALRILDYPILVGPSRKSFIGAVTALPPQERLEGSLGAAAAAAIYGADMVRVHDVRETSRLLAVVDAIRTAGECRHD